VVARRQYEPDPWQEDYERQKAAGFPKQVVRAPQPASVPTAQTIARPTVTVPPRKLIVAGVVVLLVIIAAVIGHAVASSNSIAVGDCVVTNPNVLTGWDIKKVACGSNPGAALLVQKVESVQDTSNGQCDLGLTTFQDDPAGKTYCLAGDPFGSGG
jgi:hypothetical protein